MHYRDIATDALVKNVVRTSGYIILPTNYKSGSRGSNPSGRTFCFAKATQNKFTSLRHVECTLVNTRSIEH